MSSNFGKLQTRLFAHPAVGLFFLRLFVGLRLIYGVTDNVFSPVHMQEFTVFLDAQGFPLPGMSAFVSVYAQLICGLGILLGFQTRPAALIMVLHFTIALLMVHLHDTVEGMTPALSMWSGNLCLLFTGAGRMAIDPLKSQR